LKIETGRPRRRAFRAVLPAQAARPVVASLDATVNEPSAGLASTDATVNEPSRGLASLDATANDTSTGLASLDATVNDTSTGLASPDATVNDTSAGLASLDATVNEPSRREKPTEVTTRDGELPAGFCRRCRAEAAERRGKSVYGANRTGFSSHTDSVGDKRGRAPSRHHGTTETERFTWYFNWKE
jgi:hypothetical protein